MSKLRAWLGKSLLLAAGLLAGTVAQATLIYDVTGSLTASDPTQSGRMTRNGVASDWSSSKAYPGLFNAGIQHHYQTFLLDLDALEAGYETFGKYFQINVDSESTNTFVSVYLNSYDPNNQALNYLGDAGSSGNVFGNARFFQVIAESGNDLVLVFNETTANAGLNQGARIYVEAFTDTEFTDLVERVVPVAGSLPLALLALSMAGLGRRARRAGSRATEAAC